jgi:hypothetical protein
MDRSPTLPKPEDLIKNRVYKIESRNLSFGVWDGEQNFVGIRTKFNDRFLDEEVHYDLDDHYGTVSDAQDLGIDVPLYIRIQTGAVYERMLRLFLEEIENCPEDKLDDMRKLIDIGEQVVNKNV